MYVSKVKWSNSEKGVAPPLHFGIVAIEKGAFWLPSITVTNFTYITSYMETMYIETPYISSHMGPMYIETAYISSHMGPMYITHTNVDSDIFIQWYGHLWNQREIHIIMIALWRQMDGRRERGVKNDEEKRNDKKKVARKEEEREKM